MRHHDVVFRGTVSQIDVLDASRGEPPIVVHFDVIESWKGIAGSAFTLHTIYNKYTCDGYYFKEEQEYLVFARKNRESDECLFAPEALPPESFGVSLCGGTREAKHAQEFLEQLGQGTPRRALPGWLPNVAMQRADPAERIRLCQRARARL
jgi:hypothetical protein